MKVYILSVISCSCGITDQIIEAFATFEQARAEFESHVAPNRESIKSGGDWVIEDDTETAFFAYEEGYAAMENLDIQILIREI